MHRETMSECVQTKRLRETWKDTATYAPMNRPKRNIFCESILNPSRTFSYFVQSSPDMDDTMGRPIPEMRMNAIIPSAPTRNVGWKSTCFTYFSWMVMWTLTECVCTYMYVGIREIRAN